MSLKVMKFALVGFVALAVAGSAVAAPIVTMTATPLMARTQVQGLGDYQVLDFFWTNGAGSEFSNYNIIADATTGSLFDPARLQDDRQMNPDPGGNDGNTEGVVDTWTNTVMSAAGKEDAGTPASITPNPAFYQPAGTGFAPAFDKLDWLVFDQATGDDDDLNPDLPASAPYHIARILASVGGTGTVRFDAVVNDSTAITRFDFNYGAVEPPNTPPTVTDVVIGPPYNNNEPGEPQTLMQQMTAVDAETPAGPFTWSDLSLQSFTPNYGGTGPDGQTPFIAATLTPGGLFEWVSEGSRRGDYVWQMKVTDPGLLTSAFGTMTVHATNVPEPSTIALCSLAMVGLVGMFRRRSA